MTINDIMSLNPQQIRSMSTQELRKVTQQLADAGNKRIKRLLADEVGIETRIAQKVLRESSGKPYFTIKGEKKRANIKAEFDELRQFLNPKRKQTSLRGWKKQVKEMEIRLGGSMTSEKWKVYRRIEGEYLGGFPSGYGSTEVQRLIARYNTNNPDDIYENVMMELQNEYERTEEDEREDEDYFSDIYFGDEDMEF